MLNLKGTSTDFTLLVPLIIIARADFLSHYLVAVWTSSPFKDAIESSAEACSIWPKTSSVTPASSAFSAFNKETQAPSMMMKGKAAATEIVCKGFKPPASKRTAAKAD